MTKEELEKEAEEYVKANNLEWELECHRTSPIGEVIQAYLVGAEPREKRIEQLEQENAELKADNDARKFAMTMSEKVEKQLREENTKLKTDYEVLSCSVGDFGELQDKLEEEQRKNNGLSDNLTKAKEIIKKLYSHVFQGMGFMELNDYNVQKAEAEQFLKDSEVEK